MGWEATGHSVMWGCFATFEISTSAQSTIAIYSGAFLKLLCARGRVLTCSNAAALRHALQPGVEGKCAMAGMVRQRKGGHKVGTAIFLLYLVSVQGCQAGETSRHIWVLARPY